MILTLDMLSTGVEVFLIEIAAYLPLIRAWIRERGEEKPSEMGYEIRPVDCGISDFWIDVAVKGGARLAGG